MSGIFSEDEVAKFKEAFLLFDKDETGQVMNKDVGTLIRACGENPTETEVIELIHGATSGDDTIDFQDFLTMMNTQAKQEKDTEEEVIEAFKVFDSEGSGKIGASELRNIMTSLGEKLTDDEATEMLEDAKIDGDGMLDYKELTRVIMS